MCAIRQPQAGVCGDVSGAQAPPTGPTNRPTWWTWLDDTAGHDLARRTGATKQAMVLQHTEAGCVHSQAVNSSVPQSRADVNA